MHKVLMPIDFSDATEPIVAFVAEWCAKIDMEVCVLHVSGAGLDDPKQGRAVMGPNLDQIVHRLKAAGCKARPKLVYGPTIASVLDQLDIEKPDLVIVGSHGHGAMHDLIVGSVTHSLLRSCPCPVVVVPVPRPSIQTDALASDIFGWGDAGYPIM